MPIDRARAVNANVQVIFPVPVAEEHFITLPEARGRLADLKRVGVLRVPGAVEELAAPLVRPPVDLGDESPVPIHAKRRQSASAASRHA